MALSEKALEDLKGLSEDVQEELKCANDFLNKSSKAIPLLGKDQSKAISMHLYSALVSINKQLGIIINANEGLKIDKELEEIAEMQNGIEDDVANLKTYRSQGKTQMMVLHLDTAVQSMNMEVNAIVEALKKKGILK